MTEQEFYINIGYLSNPIREINIEVEMPLRRQAGFISEYATLTNNFPLPTETDTAPYYVWGEGSDKYGLEARAYFVSNDNLPQPLYDILEPRKTQNRPGYENWQRRISTNANVLPLFEAGFVLGQIQDVNRIRGLVPQIFINDFNIGFNI